MHCVVSWDISARGERWTAVNEAMVAELGSRIWHRPLTTFYIVRIHSQSDWATLLRGLTSVANRYPDEVHFVIGPLTTGSYDGWLPKAEWPKIQQIAG